ncbi:AAA family ATPase [Deinococcus radiophilus]|uniref:AAA family ATPase n=1 Tax=Deinococcus radiophilus TaxID=32062 RepID=UPI001E304017|nr:SMC family ATPase [Deinococcus radiophilus]UFA50651.1 SMC family ATPase [Deinococcus radiophilus]
MKPLHLTVSGFTAFRQHTEIDFEGLDLFALVGPTGSGKSSLLDAMTFALYGQTARLGSTGMDALISQGERALSVALTFELHTEQGPQVYRVARSKGRRTAENETRLEQREGERWKGLAQGGGQRAVNAQIQALLGLDFRTFTKSVFLPQGEFSRLLHGTGKERQELLGELMGLQTVKDMHRYASDRAKELQFQLGSQHSVLENEYAGVTEEAVQQLRQQRTELAAQLDRWQDEREDAHVRLEGLKTVAALWQSREDAGRKLSVQQGRRAEIKRGAERAAQARRVAGILPLIDREGRARIAAERAESELRAAQAEVTQAAQALTQAQTAQEQAQAAEAQIPELEARAEYLRDAEALAARLKRAGGTPDHRHPQPLDWDEDGHAAAKADAEKLDKLKLERVQLSSRRAALDASTERLRADRELLATRKAQQARIMQDGKDAATRLERAAADHQAAQARAGLAAYAQDLQDGQPCPLCGQSVDAAHLPSHPDTAEVQRLRLALDAAGRLRDDLRGQYREITAELGVLQKDLERREAEVSDTREQLAQDEADNKVAAERISGDPADLVSRLLASLAAQVRSFGPNPVAERQKAVAQISDIRRRLSAAVQAVATASSGHAAAAATLSAAQAGAEARRAEAQEAVQELSAALDQADLSADRAKAAALPEGEIAALEQAAQTWQAGLGSLQTQVDDLSAQLTQALAGQEYDPQALPQLAQTLQALDARISQGRSDAGRLEGQERTAAERLERKRAIEAQTKELSAGMDTWRTLTNSLKANEFQQFLLAEVEANLLTGAGHILHEISDGRYRLTLDGHDYAVQDLWNAGEMRGVKTLSGGETFLASLSLAIALSDYLAGNKILGALFLDEGFGTLDPQALEAVATALENLRTQGRMVGVITHVESLSQRLPSQLLVTKSVAGSSVMRLEG